MDSVTQEHSYLFGHNATFIESLYKKYQEDPNNVDASWQNYFRNFQDDAKHLLNNVAAKSVNNPSLFHKSQQEKCVIESESTNDSAAALSLIKAYIHYGHTAVNLDPLCMSEINIHPSLKLEFHG